MKQILVAVDGSEAANRAARFAAELAGQDRSLTLLYVYDAPAPTMLGLGALSDEETRRLQANVAKGSFDAAMSAMGSSPPKIETAVELGHPGKEVVSFAKTRKVELIVMGTRGQSAVEEILLGSVSDYVLRNAHCPVTIVR